MVPIPMRRAVSLAMFKWSPVIIFTRMPAACRLRTVAPESWRGGSSMGRMPMNCQRDRRRGVAEREVSE